jgi:uncharacterized lipoprotein YddW (UPF0748 family)
MRGLWVDAFHPGFKTPEQTSAMVAKARSCGFNALFVQVRKRGDVYYRSSVEPLAKDSQVGYDALADIITKAHAAGLEVHAWISVYEVYRDSKWSKSDAGMVHLRHPEWIMKDEFGKAVFPGEKVYLDPALPDVNTYLVGLVDEIVRGYDIDGIHLDNVRYPAQEGGYSEAGISRFNSESGRTGKPASDDQAWCNWRKAQVTQFVQAVYQRATSIRRQVKVSAAVFANREDAAGHRFQDWEAWLRAGILDFAVPMNFALDTRVFEMKCSDAKTLSTGRAIYMGQGAYKMGADAAVDQIATARSAGFGGVVVYSYAYCLNPRGEDAISVMDALKAGPFAQADTVPTLSWKQ